MFLEVFNLAPKLGRQLNSLVVECCQMGLQLCYFEQIMLFLVKLNPEFSSKSIIKGQSNLSIVFIFVSYEEKDCYGVVSVGQFSLSMYCGRSRHMQGNRVTSTSGGYSL